MEEAEEARADRYRKEFTAPLTLNGAPVNVRCMVDIELETAELVVRHSNGGGTVYWGQGDEFPVQFLRTYGDERDKYGFATVAYARRENESVVDEVHVAHQTETQRFAMLERTVRDILRHMGDVLAAHAAAVAAGRVAPGPINYDAMSDAELEALDEKWLFFPQAGDSYEEEIDISARRGLHAANLIDDPVKLVPLHFVPDDGIDTESVYD